MVIHVSQFSLSETLVLPLKYVKLLAVFPLIGS